ncbi:MAG: hypothetical protein ACRDPY_15475 [Streptosporangiaceae bacterium]
MSESPDSTARLEGVIGSVAKTFDELASQIGSSAFPEEWKEDGIWASGVLAGVLGPDWLDKFATESGTPYLRFVLAPHRLAQLAAMVEFAARLKLLAGSPGMSEIGRQMRRQLEPGVMGHASLQLEVAGLEYRRSGAAIMEATLASAGWKPDVLLYHGSTPIGVECLRLGISDEVASHLATPGAPERVIDAWQRIGARIIVKAAQPAQAGGWLRCELDDGMFADQPWFSSALVAMSLQDKAATLVSATRQSMQTIGDMHGVVLSSPATSDANARDETHRHPDSYISLRRRLPGERVRETFIIPSDHAAQSESDIWAELYDEESTWLAWALQLVKPE